ncbi:hypothetical protein [Nonomuraea roseola]|uniref:Uncharacterized protein n=1 Tax=Nonomuraea roseola TaxID=46179 RepID=A0ABV5Q0T9_9ACTN
MIVVEVVTEETLYVAKDGTVRVERTTYSDGMTEWTSFRAIGASPLNCRMAGEHIPTLHGGRAVTLAGLIHDDGLVGMIYRPEGE